MISRLDSICTTIMMLTITFVLVPLIVMLAGTVLYQILTGGLCGT